jgi:methionine-rich copper-binding protein CopC
MQRLLAPLALLAVAGTAAPAAAHAFLDHSVPAVGSTVAVAPKQVAMFFTQDLEPHFSGATLSTASGQPVPTGQVQGQLARRLGRHTSHGRRFQLRGPAVRIGRG